MMGRLINRWLNNTSLKRKNLYITLIGALLPITILLVAFSYQLYQQMVIRQDLMIDSVIERVNNNVETAFSTSRNIAIDYVSDSNVNRILEETSFRMNEDVFLGMIGDIENKIELDIYTNEYISGIELYYNNDNFNYVSDTIAPLSTLEDRGWYKEFLENPRYLYLIPEIDDGEVSLHMVKSLNQNDIYSENIVHIWFDGRALRDMLYDEFFAELDGDIYFVTPDNRIIASNHVLYTIGLEEFFVEGDLNLNAENQIAVEFNEVVLDGWKVDYVVDNGLLESMILSQFGLILVAVVIIFILLIVLTYMIEQSIAKRIILLNESMEKVEEGNFETIDEDVGNDEIASTIGYYNDMVSTISNYIYKDTLTGITNRSSSMYEIKKLMDERRLFYIIFLDIDDFKLINDTYGHDIGDEVIKAMAKVLMEAESDKVSISRFGGDEFVIIVKQDNNEELIYRFVDEIKERLSRPIHIDDLRFAISASMGIARYPDHAFNTSGLMKKADMALHKAKEQGKNCYVFFTEDMEQEFEEKLSFQNHVKDAFGNREFYLHYQPLYRTDSETIGGMEALIRWDSEIYGKVSPFKLIQNAEEMGLITELGEWIFKEAALFIKKINKSIKEPLPISINISMIQVMSPGFYETITGIVREIGIDPKYIVLEMTETVLIDSLERGVAIVNQLVDFGFGVAIDDFGTGYSSLKYLQVLPVTGLKIDRGFISQINTNSFDRDLVKVIVDIAHKQDIYVVAEGVEEKEQLKWMSDMDVDYIQGYYYSKPVSGKALLGLVRDQERDKG